MESTHLLQAVKRLARAAERIATALEKADTQTAEYRNTPAHSISFTDSKEVTDGKP